MKTQRTKVIFRKWPKSEGGDVIALFPSMAGTYDPWTCGSYQHVGQHCSASVDLPLRTRKAQPAEYAELARELRRIGYKLDIRHRFTSADLAARKEQLKR